MHLPHILPTALLLLLAHPTTTTAFPTSPPRRSAATYSCNVSPAHPASRLGATKCLEALQQTANEIGGPTGGTLRVPLAGEPARVSEYAWTTDRGNELWSFVDVVFLGDPAALVAANAADDTTEDLAADAVVEVSRREVAGMLVGMIEACSDRGCADLDCPVSGAFRILDGAVEVRLVGA